MIFRFEKKEIFMNNICMIYGLLMSIIGGALSISFYVTDSKNESLLNCYEVRLCFKQ